MGLEVRWYEFSSQLSHWMQGDLMMWDLDSLRHPMSKSATEVKGPLYLIFRGAENI